MAYGATPSDLTRTSSCQKFTLTTSALDGSNLIFKAEPNRARSIMALSNRDGANSLLVEAMTRLNRDVEGPASPSMKGLGGGGATGAVAMNGKGEK